MLARRLQNNDSPMKGRILLADDDDDVLAALRKALLSEGYEVIVARNGREAVERFKEGHVDVALLDLRMPHRRRSVYVGSLRGQLDKSRSLANRVTVCEQRLATKHDHLAGRPVVQWPADR
jgi:CheY-like chemotaxis protein